MAAAIGGGVGIGAGVGVSSVALMPFNTANTFLGSAFFGYGMILGERYMYQADWPKIQQRLENGEKIENIIQEYTGRFTAVVMAEAKIIFNSVTQEMLSMMKQAFLDAFPKSPLDEIRPDAPTIGDPRRPRPPSTIPETPKPQPPPNISGGVKLPPVQVPNVPTRKLPKATQSIINFINKMKKDLKHREQVLDIIKKGTGQSAQSKAKSIKLVSAQISQIKSAISATMKNWDFS